MARQKRRTAKEEGPAEGRDLQSLLGPAPLLEGEDADAYEELNHRVRAAVGPVDVIEEIWVRDIVDLLWETMRLRRLKVAYLQAYAHEGLNELLKSLVGDIRYNLVLGWRRGETAARREVRVLLRQAGLDEEVIIAETLSLNLYELEQIDRMIMQTEARRNAALREVDRRREAVARRLREACAVVEDAELVELPPPQRDAAE